MIGLRRGLSVRSFRLTTTRQQKLSSSAAESGTEAAATAKKSTDLLEGSDTYSLGKVVRHGSGDAVITLNVGGKEFTTLRSTVNSNAVLADLVSRAEYNKELTKTGAVFIDRDPAYFDLILKHIRNRVEMQPDATKSTNINWMTFTRSHLLPEKRDDKMLRELYIEATYYRIPELQAALTEQNFLAKMFRIIGGKNPFDAVHQTMERMRTWLLFITTISVSGATVAIQRDFDAFLKFIGWRKADYNPKNQAKPAAT